MSGWRILRWENCTKGDLQDGKSRENEGFQRGEGRLSNSNLVYFKNWPLPWRNPFDKKWCRQQCNYCKGEDNKKMNPPPITTFTL